MTGKEVNPIRKFLNVIILFLKEIKIQQEVMLLTTIKVKDNNEHRKQSK
jgi:hypothetical protein